MHIKVVDPRYSFFNEFDIYIHVVQNNEKHVIDSNLTAAVRENNAILLGFLTFTLITSETYDVKIKYVTEDDYDEIPFDYNTRALCEWLLHEKARFKFKNVTIRIDKFLKIVEIYVREKLNVYINGKYHSKGGHNAHQSY